MKKVILDLAVTLDGFIEGPNGEVDWCIMEDDDGVDFINFVNSIDTVFYGRKSYDLWGNFKPGEKASSVVQEVYRLLPTKKKYVFSTSKKDDSTGATFVNDNIQERVREIKRQPGKDIWLYGGGNLITTFMNLDLVDIFRLAIHPVILGSGKPLFKGIATKVNLNLINTQSSKSGVVLLEYMANKNFIN